MLISNDIVRWKGHTYIRSIESPEGISIENVIISFRGTSIYSNMLETFGISKNEFADIILFIAENNPECNVYCDVTNFSDIHFSEHYKFKYSSSESMFKETHNDLISFCQLFSNFKPMIQTDSDLPINVKDYKKFTALEKVGNLYEISDFSISNRDRTIFTFQDEYTSNMRLNKFAKFLRSFSEDPATIYLGNLNIYSKFNLDDDADIIDLNVIDTKSIIVDIILKRVLYMNHILDVGIDDLFDISSIADMINKDIKKD